MQQILQQAQSDPGALQEHMKNPVVRGKIQKLVNAGIIRTRWSGLQSTHYAWIYDAFNLAWNIHLL